MEGAGPGAAAELAGQLGALRVCASLTNGGADTPRTARAARAARTARTARRLHSDRSEHSDHELSSSGTRNRTDTEGTSASKKHVEDVNSVQSTSGASDDETCSVDHGRQLYLVETLERAIDGLESALGAEHARYGDRSAPMPDPQNEREERDERKEPDEIRFVSYESELQMAEIMKLIQKDLSEPYSIYTYRYFIHNWPKLCFLAMHKDRCVGAIVCKLDVHRNSTKRGYIAMLAVDEKYRKRKIGSSLVRQAIQAMIQDNADEVVLETEITNKPALRLYENLGFVRDKRLFRYYLNGVDALRLKLWLR